MPPGAEDSDSDESSTSGRSRGDRGGLFGDDELNGGENGEDEQDGSTRERGDDGGIFAGFDGSTSGGGSSGTGGSSDRDTSTSDDSGEDEERQEINPGDVSAEFRDAPVDPSDTEESTRERGDRGGLFGDDGGSEREPDHSLDDETAEESSGGRFGGGPTGVPSELSEEAETRQVSDGRPAPTDELSAEERQAIRADLAEDSPFEEADFRITDVGVVGPPESETPFEIRERFSADQRRRIREDAAADSEVFDPDDIVITGIGTEDGEEVFEFDTAPTEVQVDTDFFAQREVAAELAAEEFDEFDASDFSVTATTESDGFEVELRDQALLDSAADQDDRFEPEDFEVVEVEPERERGDRGGIFGDDESTEASTTEMQRAVRVTDDALLEQTAQATPGVDADDLVIEEDGTVSISPERQAESRQVDEVARMGTFGVDEDLSVDIDETQLTPEQEFLDEISGGRFAPLVQAGDDARAAITPGDDIPDRGVAADIAASGLLAPAAVTAGAAAGVRDFATQDDGMIRVAPGVAIQTPEIGLDQEVRQAVDEAVAAASDRLPDFEQQQGMDAVETSMLEGERVDDQEFGAEGTVGEVVVAGVDRIPTPEFSEGASVEEVETRMLGGDRVDDQEFGAEATVGELLLDGADRVPTPEFSEGGSVEEVETSMLEGDRVDDQEFGAEGTLGAVALAGGDRLSNMSLLNVPPATEVETTMLEGDRVDDQEFGAEATVGELVVDGLEDDTLPGLLDGVSANQERGGRIVSEDIAADSREVEGSSEITETAARGLIRGDVSAVETVSGAGDAAIPRIVSASEDFSSLAPSIQQEGDIVVDDRAQRLDGQRVDDGIFQFEEVDAEEVGAAEAAALVAGRAGISAPDVRTRLLAAGVLGATALTREVQDDLDRMVRPSELDVGEPQQDVEELGVGATQQNVEELGVGVAQQNVAEIDVGGAQQDVQELTPVDPTAERDPTELQLDPVTFGVQRTEREEEDEFDELDETTPVIPGDVDDLVREETGEIARQQLEQSQFVVEQEFGEEEFDSVPLRQIDETPREIDDIEGGISGVGEPEAFEQGELFGDRFQQVAEDVRREQMAETARQQFAESQLLVEQEFGEQLFDTVPLRQMDETPGEIDDIEGGISGVGEPEAFEQGELFGERFQQIAEEELVEELLRNPQETLEEFEEIEAIEQAERESSFAEQDFRQLQDIEPQQGQLALADQELDEEEDLQLRQEPLGLAGLGFEDLERLDSPAEGAPSIERLQESQLDMSSSQEMDLEAEAAVEQSLDMRLGMASVSETEVQPDTTESMVEQNAMEQMNVIENITQSATVQSQAMATSPMTEFVNLNLQLNQPGQRPIRPPGGGSAPRLDKPRFDDVDIDVFSEMADRRRREFIFELDLEGTEAGVVGDLGDLDDNFDVGIDDIEPAF